MEKNIDQDQRLLPIVVCGCTEYFVDIDFRHFRQIDDSANRISFYSESGKKMVKMMAGSEWKTYGIDNLNLQSAVNNTIDNACCEEGL